MEGEVKSVTIRNEGRDFYISVLCDIGDKYENIKNPSSNVVGIDRGIAKSLAYSDGSFAELPKPRIRLLEEKIAKLQSFQLSVLPGDVKVLQIKLEDSQ